MKNPFFTTGGTLAISAPSYVERQADRDLYEGLLGGEYCYVLTSRQMGKSSLMARTGVRLRAQGVRVAMLDLTSLGQNMTAEQWYEGMAEVLGEQLGLEDEVLTHWHERREVPPLRRWMSLLKDVILPAAGIQAFGHSGIQDPNTPTLPHFHSPLPHTDTPPHRHTPTPTPPSLIIFIDEIDAVLSLPFSTDEFFAGIRECYNRRSTDPHFQQLVFCLLGVATPSDLIRDVRTTPFNIGQRIELTDFTEAEALPLAAGLLPNEALGVRPQALGSEPALSMVGSSSTPNAQRLMPDANRLLQRVLYWTGGHPYLTQRLCRAVAEAPPDRDWRAAVDSRCRDLFLSAQGWERDDNLLFVRDRLLRTGTDVATLLELLGRIQTGRRVPPDETNPVLDLLRLSGIIRVGGTAGNPRRTCEMRNRIYAEVFDREWIQRHMPDAELRRQRAAFRRGMARASALAGVVLFVMLLLTLTAVDRAQVAREAQQEVGQANRSLRSSLHTQEELNRRLEAALEDSRKAHSHASRAAEAALTAGRREHEQRKSAEGARSAALASELTANRARQEAVNRLSRACIDASTRAAGTGDLLGSLPPLADALRLDQGNPEREPIHRIRLAYLLRESPRLRDMWNAGSEVRSLAMSSDGTRAAAGSDGGRVRLFDLHGDRPARDLLQSAGNVVSLTFSPDCTRLATADQAGTARVWDAQSGRPRTPPLAGLGRLRCVTWHPSGRRIAVAGDNGTVVWELDPVRRVCQIPFPRAENCQAVYSPDGRKLAVVSGNHLGWMVNAETGVPLFHLARCYNGSAAEFSPDGAHLLVGGTFGNPAPHVGGAVLDANTGAVVRYLDMATMAYTARFSHDGRRVVLGDRNGNVRVWDPFTGSPISPLTHLEQEVTTVAFSPDGQQVVAASRDGLATVRDAVTGQPVCAPLRHGRWVVAADFSDDGRYVLTTSRDGAARIWELPPPAAPPDFAEAALVAPDAEFVRVEHLAGDRWAVGLIRNRAAPHLTPEEGVRVWDSRTGQLRAPGKWRRFAVSPDKRWLVLAGEAGLQLWEVATGRARSSLHPINLPEGELRLHPTGRWLAVHERKPSGNGPLSVVDLYGGGTTLLSSEPVDLVHGFFADGQTLWFNTDRGATMVWRVPFAGQRTGVATRLPLETGWASVQASRYGRTVMTSTNRGVFHTWDGHGRPLARKLRFDNAHIWVAGFGASFSDDSRLVVLFALGEKGRRNHSIGTVLDVKRRTEIRLPGGDTMPMYHSVVFTPARDRFAAYSHDGEIQIWDVRTGRPLTPVMHHSTRLPAVVFSADGRKLLTGAIDGTARVWDATTGRPLTPFLPHPASVLAASFSPDGRLVLTRSADRLARVWDAHTGEGVVLPLNFGRPVDDCRFLPDSRRVLAQCGPRALIRDLVPDARPIPELARRCLLLASHRADGNGGLEALEPEQLRATWRKDRP